MKTNGIEERIKEKQYLTLKYKHIINSKCFLVHNYKDILKLVNDYSNFDAEFIAAKQKYYDEKIQNETNLDKIKRIILNRFFEAFGYGNERFIKYYLQLCLENPGDFVDEETKKMIKILSCVIYGNDAESLKQLYQSLKEENIDYSDTLRDKIIESRDELKAKYSRDLSTKYEETCDAKAVTVRDGVTIVDLSEQHFCLLIHNTQAGVADSKASQIISKNADYFLENKSVDTLSCSLVSDCYLGYADHSKRQPIVYGFNNLDDETIFSISCQDAQVDWGKTQDEAPFMECGDEWLCTSPYEHSLNTSSSSGYNEVVVWRNKQGKHIKPDYILCFDEITEEAINHAKHFGIPIYFIDRKKCLSKSMKDVESMVDEINSQNLEYSLLSSAVRKLSAILYGAKGYEEKSMLMSNEDINNTINCLKSAILSKIESEEISDEERILLGELKKTIENLENYVAKCQKEFAEKQHD